ncbi:hypothetical protein NP233_g8949 [Leucocoprinus birnbaumii]|uniref:F-box domain-containing protein n=1 Tax=Leucocoprinus birnbaumii TaxID=56174 RepID=A0AAD5YNL4_9AGAR|nr:hypothetical protein NP233_g8949 [Leucocoprinus birnbaumii]
MPTLPTLLIHSLISTYLCVPMELEELSTLRTTLRLVCHQWNSMIKNSALCWSTFHLIRGKTNVSHVSFTSHLRASLELSNNAPLSIQIRGQSNGPFGIWVPHEVQDYLDILAERIKQWAELEIMLVEAFPLSILRLLSRYPFSNAAILKHFSLISVASTESIAVTVALVTEAAPALKCLELTTDAGSQFFYNIPIDHTPFERITSLHLGVRSVMAASSVLPHFRSIATLRFELLRNNPPLGSTDITISLPALRTLILSGTHSQRLLPTLDIPQLETLFCDSELTRDLIVFLSHRKLPTLVVTAVSGGVDGTSLLSEEVAANVGNVEIVATIPQEIHGLY